MTEQLQSLDNKTLNHLFITLSREHRRQLRNGNAPVQTTTIRHQMNFVHSIILQRSYNHLSPERLPIQDIV